MTFILDLNLKMKLIKPSFEILEQTPGIQGVKKQIELAGRTCYKSEDKITDTSCEEFVSRMVNSGHGAMLEHGTVYLRLPNSILYQIDGLTEKYYRNHYSKCRNVLEQLHADSVYCESVCYVTTNYRVLVENGWLDDLQYQCEPTEHHEKRITVKFICDRGVSHEFVRHRVFSFAQESTRYCNYSKDKFGNGLTCILPPWELDGSYLEFEEDLRVIESIYFKWLKKGWKAQEARYFLPTGVKTELVITGFVSDWEHFFKLRCHSTAHPQARELAVPLKEEFIKKGYING
jgi:thymidylate synthase (FAD)